MEQELDKTNKNYTLLTGGKNRLNQVDRDIYKFSKLLMEKYTKFNEEKIRYIEIILSNKSMTINFNNGISKTQKLDENFKDALFTIIEDRKKVYKNQIVDSIRIDLLTKKIFVKFSDFNQ